jgi:hypothetical protein
MSPGLMLFVVEYFCSITSVTEYFCSITSGFQGFRRNMRTRGSGDKGVEYAHDAANNGRVHTSTYTTMMIIYAHVFSVKPEKKTIARRLS